MYKALSKKKKYVKSRHRVHLVFKSFSHITCSEMRSWPGAFSFIQFRFRVEVITILMLEENPSGALSSHGTNECGTQGHGTQQGLTWKYKINWIRD